MKRSNMDKDEKQLRILINSLPNKNYASIPKKLGSAMRILLTMSIHLNSYQSILHYKIKQKNTRSSPYFLLAYKSLRKMKDSPKT